MRALGSRLVLLAAVSGLAFGCGKSEGDSQTPAAAGHSLGGSSSAGASSSLAGASATAGSESDGGGPRGGGAAGGASGGVSSNGGRPDAQAGTGDDGGGASGLVDCDPKKILCKRATPICDAGEVPSVEGSCYGDCVKVEQCGCNAAEQCPQPDQYTCWAKQHCGPYVQ